MEQVTDTHAFHSRLRRALALIESEPDTVGLYSAARELREVLGMHARGVADEAAPTDLDALFTKEIAALEELKRAFVVLQGPQ